MFAKVFEQIFDSSIAQDYTVRHLFMDLLVLADQEGVVDMTYEAIARRTNVPIKIVRRCIEELSNADESSRSPECEGRRLAPIDSRRGWGWKIVNYEHYRAIRDEEARRSYFRNYQRQRRSKDKSLTNGDKVESSASVSASDIYSEYPRKIGKPKAIQSINKALKKADPQWLLQKTKDYAAAVKGSDPQYVPHPATWFNQERFNDDPTTWSRASGSSSQTAKQRKEERSRGEFPSNVNRDKLVWRPGQRK